MDTSLSAPGTGGRRALLTVGQLAQWLSCSTKLIYRKVARGTIPHVRIGYLTSRWGPGDEHPAPVIPTDTEWASTTVLRCPL